MMLQKVLLMASDYRFRLGPYSLVTLFGMLVGVACASNSTTPSLPPRSVTPSLVPTSTAPVVVSTRMTALLEGKLESEGRCLKITYPEGHEAYTLAWPADFRYSFDGKTLVVEDMLLGGSKTWSVGDTIEIGGGELANLDSSLSDTVPEECGGPYWVFGGWLRK